MSDDESIRLNTFIAQHLDLGRRAADTLIADGKVTINGIPAVLGGRVRSGDIVRTQGKELRWQSTPSFLYILMDKPTGYVCSRRQQGDTPTVYALLPSEYHHLKTVGRLDKDSSGLLLLTNDGHLAHQLTHPKFAKIKKYEVTLDKALAPLHHQLIADKGISLPDGSSKLQIERLKDNNDNDWLVTMREGRNRQIRRTFAALGYTVIRLRRIQFGAFNFAQLQGRRFLKLNYIVENT